VNATATVKLGLVGLAAAATLALGGCSLMADITTHKPYDPSDGVGAHIDDVAVQNFLVVATGEGEEAVLIGSLTNAGDERVGVKLSRENGEGDTVTVLVEGGETARIGTAPGRTLILSTAETAPGSLAHVTVEVVGGSKETLAVPVVDGTLPEYGRVLDSIGADE